jgi:serine/threonine-protein kinase
VAAAPRPKPRDDAARARERQRVAVAAPAPITPPAPPPEGIVQLAVTPWGNVEVDGRPAGTTPPLTRLNLPAGAHQIVIRNEDFTPFTATVTVNEDKPVTVRHRFGS